MSFRRNDQQYSYAYAIARTMDADGDDVSDDDDDGMTRYHAIANSWIRGACSMQTYHCASPQSRARWTVMMPISDIMWISYELRPVVRVAWSPTRLSDVCKNIR